MLHTQWTPAEERSCTSFTCDDNNAGIDFLTIDHWRADKRTELGINLHDFEKDHGIFMEYLSNCGIDTNKIRIIYEFINANDTDTIVKILKLVMTHQKMPYLFTRVLDILQKDLE